MFGPSLGELSGSGCVSQNRPSMPTAAAARASGSTIARLPPVALPKSARLLHAVRRVEHHRHAESLHLRNGPHVVHQPAVAEKRAPLAENHILAAGGGELVDHVPHVAGGQELGFFHMHRPAGCGRRHEQIGLPAQERGNLQQIANLGHRSGLMRFVDIGRRPAGRFPL